MYHITQTHTQTLFFFKETVSTNFIHLLWLQNSLARLMQVISSCWLAPSVLVTILSTIQIYLEHTYYSVLFISADCFHHGTSSCFLARILARLTVLAS